MRKYHITAVLAVLVLALSGAGIASAVTPPNTSATATTTTASSTTTTKTTTSSPTTTTTSTSTTSTPTPSAPATTPSPISTSTITRPSIGNLALFYSPQLCLQLVSAGGGTVTFTNAMPTGRPLGGTCNATLSCPASVPSGNSAVCTVTASSSFAQIDYCDWTDATNGGGSTTYGGTGSFTTGSLTVNTTIDVACYDKSVPTPYAMFATATITVTSSGGGCGTSCGGGGTLPTITVFKVTNTAGQSVTTATFGQTLLMPYGCANATSAYIYDALLQAGWYTIGTSGTITTALFGLGVNPATFHCVNGAGQVQTTISVNVVPAGTGTVPTITSFAPTAPGVMQGQSTTLKGNVTNSPQYCVVTSNVAGTTAAGWGNIIPVSSTIAVTTPLLPTSSSTYKVTYSSYCHNAYGNGPTVTTQVMAGAQGDLASSVTGGPSGTSTRTTQGGYPCQTNLNFTRGATSLLSSLLGKTLWRYLVGPMSVCFDPVRGVFVNVSGNKGYDSGSVWLSWFFNGTTTSYVQGYGTNHLVVFNQASYQWCLAKGVGCVQNVNPWIRLDAYIIGDGASKVLTLTWSKG